MQPHFAGIGNVQTEYGGEAKTAVGTRLVIIAEMRQHEYQRAAVGYVVFGDTAVQRNLQLIPGDCEGMQIGSSRDSSGILLSGRRVSEQRSGFIDFLSPNMQGVFNPDAVKDQVRGYGVRGTPPQVRGRTIEYEPTQGSGFVREVIALGIEPRT